MPQCKSLGLLLLPFVSAVLHGDEAFTAVKEGKFYVFCDGDVANGGPSPSIDVVDPVTMQTVMSIPVENTTSWSDPVYMETCDGSKKRYVMANDRSGFTHVIDPNTVERNNRIPVSERPVHGYAVPQYEEFWLHADGAGVFDVIELKDVTKLATEDVAAHITIPGHGKLIWDPDLLPFGYVSNVAEPSVYEINLQTKQLVRQFNFTEYGTGHPFYCPGTHGLAYSSINRHVYATCSNVGLIELDVTNWQVVTKHGFAAGGQVYESKDGKYIVNIDKAGNAVHILEPGLPGQSSSLVFPSVNATALTGSIAGSPDKVAFHMLSDGGVRMFFSLTQPNDVDGNAGIGWIDSKVLESEPRKTHNLNFVGGSSVKRGAMMTHRAIYGGGDYIATVSDFPTAGAMIVEAETGASKGISPTNMNPARVIWVPDSFTGNTCSEGTGNDDDDEKLSGGAIAGIVIAVVIGCGLLALAVWFCIKRSQSLPPSKSVKLEDSKTESSTAEKQVQANV